MNKYGIEIGITKHATPEQVRAEWCKWLESGKFQQATGKLCKLVKITGSYSGEAMNASMCCLGVLCEIGVELGLVVAEEDNSYDSDADRLIKYMTVGGNDYSVSSVSNLPHVMCRFAGITPNGELKEGIDKDDAGPNDTPVENLIGLNDTFRLSFAQIAEVIKTKEFVPLPSY